MKMLKNLGLIVFGVLLLISLAFIVYPEVIKPVGVTITSVEPDSPCEDIMNVGSTITGVGNKVVKNSDEFYELTKDLDGIVTFIIDKNPRTCNIPEGSKLNVTVMNARRGGVKLGTDLWGGVYYLFELEGSDEDVIGIIKQRPTKYGLSNTKIELYNDSFIRITTGPDEESYVNFLIETGKLEGRIIEEVDFNKKTIEFMFNDKTFEMSLKNEKSLVINNSVYGIGDHISLDGVDAIVKNISENTTTLSIKIFDNEDLTLIQSSSLGYSRITRQGSGYVFIVPVELSEGASEAFQKATKNIEVLVNPNTGESYSKYPINIFIDGKEFFSIPILSDDMGKKSDTLILWNYLPGANEATENMVRLKTLIEMKSLPQELTFVERDVFKSSYGDSLITSLLIVVLVSSVATIMLFFVKFKKRGIASLPLILMVLSEFILILGVIYTNWFALIIFSAGVLVIFIRGGIYNWKGWVGVFLFFMLITGMVVSKWGGGWVLDGPFIIGLMVTVLIGFLQNGFVGTSVLKKKESYTLSDYKELSIKLWLFLTVFALILIILYFILNFMGLMSTGFIMALSIGLWVNLSLITPVYWDIVKNYSK
jgi:hypothetical protein